MSKLKLVEVMKRASFLRDGEKMILKFDLSNLNDVEDVKKIAEYFRSMVTKMPQKSLVGLVDFTGLKIADEVVHEMIQLTELGRRRRWPIIRQPRLWWSLWLTISGISICRSIKKKNRPKSGCSLNNKMSSLCHYLMGGNEHQKE